jgi:hypothetical protein
MIRETPEDFLTIIKSYSPDPNQPIGVVRKDFFMRFMKISSTGDPAGFHSPQQRNVGSTKPKPTELIHGLTI